MLPLRRARLAAAAFAGFLAAPLCVGITAQTQSHDPRQTSGDSVGILTSGAPAVFFETEPNGTAGTADSISTQLAAARYLLVAGAINPGGDLDYFSFTAAAGSRIWLVADTGGPQNPGASSRDSVLDLLAADGTTVIETDDEDGTGNGGDGTVESVSASVIAGRTLTAGGTYYIRIRGFTPSGIIDPYRLFVVYTTAAPTAEVENNNTAAVANVAVAMGTSFSLRSASIGVVGDVDYYAVAAPAGTVIYFAVDADPERDGIGTDVAVDLFSPDGVQLLSVDSGLTTGSLGDPTAEGANFHALGSDGVYYIRVKHYNNTATGTYHLMTAVTMWAESEPNDTVPTADAINFQSSVRRCAIIAGAISPGGDVDFYSFQAAAGSRVWIETDTGGTQHGGATSRDTIIDLMKVAGGEFAIILEADNDDGTGNGGDGTIETGTASMIGGKTLVEGGTYYIRVRSSDTGIINPYKLFVVLTNSQTETAAESESNNTAATANVLTDATPIRVRTGAIGSAGDVDYYSIVAAAGAIVYFNVDADPERDDIGTDLVVEFRSPADALLLSVDSSVTGSAVNPAAEGANFVVTETAGTYYLKVRHFAPGGTGTYHVMAIAASGNPSSGFTDSPLTATVSTIRAVHVTELRTRINALRGRFSLGDFGWSHPSLAGAVVDADDLTELRTALSQAYVAAGMTELSYVDAVLVPQSTVIKADHIEQVRIHVIVLESS